MAATTAKDVIDWDEAMEQCGDDEEFLRELLADLRGETDEQIEKIEETIANPVNNPFHRIMRAAHVVKGAASNLMCSQLRDTSKALEKAASTGNDLGSGDVAAIQAAWNDVIARFAEMKKAVESYHAFLKSIGI